MRRVLKLSLAVLAALVLAALVPLRRVQGDAMAPNLREGDLVWIVPARPLKGDVVRMRDPFDPSAVVLRRAMTGGTKPTIRGEPHKAKYEEGGVRVDGKRLRQQDEVSIAAGAMFAGVEGWTLFKETIWSPPPARALTYWVRRRPENVMWKSDVVEVPLGTWYVLADDRDGALDSRWWGPIPESAIDGVVRFRWGPSDERRARWEWMKGWPEWDGVKPGDKKKKKN